MSDNQGKADPFAFFIEIGIINQLASSLLAKALPDGVHPSHFAILNHLSRTGDGKTPISIASAMQVAKNTMTHSLRLLENKGFIEVSPNPEDARGKLVFLTEAGRDFRETAIERLTERFGSLIEEQHESAMNRTIDDLSMIRKHLDANR